MRNLPSVDDTRCHDARTISDATTTTWTTLRVGVILLCLVTLSAQPPLHAEEEMSQGCHSKSGLNDKCEPVCATIGWFNCTDPTYFGCNCKWHED